MDTKLPTLYLIPLSRKAAQLADAPATSIIASPLECGYDLVDSSGNVHSTHWNVEGYHPAVSTDVKVAGYHVVQFMCTPIYVDTE